MESGRKRLSWTKGSDRERKSGNKDFSFQFKTPNWKRSILKNRCINLKFLASPGWKAEEKDDLCENAVIEREIKISPAVTKPKFEKDRTFKIDAKLRKSWVPPVWRAEEKDDLREKDARERKVGNPPSPPWDSLRRWERVDDWARNGER